VTEGKRLVTPARPHQLSPEPWAAAAMADLLYKRLETIDREVEDKEAELKATLEELRKNPGDNILLAERNRLVEALADLNARRKNLEDKLPGGCGWANTRRVLGNCVACSLAQTRTVSFCWLL
jgi:hypothetical protein